MTPIALHAATASLRAPTDGPHTVDHAKVNTRRTDSAGTAAAPRACLHYLTEPKPFRYGPGGIIGWPARGHISPPPRNPRAGPVARIRGEEYFKQKVRPAPPPLPPAPERRTTTLQEHGGSDSQRGYRTGTTSKCSICPTSQWSFSPVRRPTPWRAGCNRHRPVCARCTNTARVTEI